MFSIVRLLLVFLLIPLFSTKTFAETEDAQFWTQYVASGEIADDTLLFLEFQPRAGGDFDGLNLFIARGAIGFRLNSNWSLWQGYGWVPVYSDQVLSLIHIS